MAGEVEEDGLRNFLRKLRHAAREERETFRRRNAVRRALEEAGALTEETARLVDESSDPAVLEDLARPLRAARAADSVAGASPDFEWRVALPSGRTGSATTLRFLRKVVPDTLDTRPCGGLRSSSMGTSEQPGATAGRCVAYL